MSKRCLTTSALLAAAKHSFLCVLFVFVSTTNLSAERFPIKTYTVADGLLRDAIKKIKQDSRGFLWFCSSGGLSRFDGYAFRNFTDEDGLPDRHVNDFLETTDGTIWIATDAGLARLDPMGLPGSISDPLFHVLVPENPRAKSIEVLFEDQHSTIWVGTSDGLYRLSDSQELERVDLDQGISNTNPVPISSIIEDRQGSLWIGAANRVRRILPGGRFESFGTENGLLGNVSIVYEDKVGRIWVGFRAGGGSGLVMLVPNPIEGTRIVERHYTEKEGLTADWVTDMRETSDGKFWVATTGGLCEWQTGSDTVCKTYTTKNDLCDRDIWTIIEDRDRNLWIGSRCGAKKWTPYGFTSYTEADGMGYSLANSIFENATGELFVSFNTGDTRTLSRFDGEGFKLIKPSFPAATYFGWGWKQTVHQDGKGEWWFPTGDGLFLFPRAVRFDDLSKTVPRRVDTGAKGNEIFRIFEDSRQDIWIATTGLANELLRWDRATNVWHNLTTESGLQPDRVATAFVEDPSGNLWIGTGSDHGNTALLRYREGAFTIFPQTQNPLLGGWLRDLFVDRASRLWIANADTGLLRLDDLNAEQLHFVRYTTGEGLSTTGVWCITEDEFGRIYIGTGRGLDRLNPDTGQVENFTTVDGLPNSYVEVAFRDRHSTLWFGTGNGVARLIPTPERDRQPPNVLLTGLRVNGEPRSVSILGETAIPTVELDSNHRQVTVDFLGLGTSLGEKLRYEYRLGESDWTATTERTVNFANLDSDSYRFEVRAITADRIYSQPATLSFTIAAPIWLRWWFVAGLVALTGFIIYTLYRYRLRRLLELERIRTRIATDLHDDIGSNLTRIALLSEAANQQEQAGVGASQKQALLPSIAEIARESVASMNDIVWAISPDHDSLLDLTRRMRRHAEEVLGFGDIDLEFNAPLSDSDLKLSVSVRRDLLLIFKEAINNLTKHSGCTRVRIDFRQEGSLLKMSINDNGGGFETGAETDGYGLQSMARRTTSLGGRLKIESSRDGGTTIAVELPLLKVGRI